jgi:hypothetical protein
MDLPVGQRIKSPFLWYPAQVKLSGPCPNRALLAAIVDHDYALEEL